MKNVALISGCLASILSLGSQAVVLRMTHGFDRGVATISVIFSILTIVAAVVSYIFPMGKDYERLARERAEREARKNEKERFLRLRKEEDDLRRQEAETQKIQTEALLVQQRYEEEQRRLARNARARERRRQERGLPPETSRMAEPRSQAPTTLPKESQTSALDAILSDDDDDLV